MAINSSCVFNCHASRHRLREAFPAGLATSRADFERQLAALPQPDLASLGNYVMRTDLKGGDGGAVEVKQATLCSAHPSIKVRKTRLVAWQGRPSNTCMKSRRASSEAMCNPAPHTFTRTCRAQSCVALIYVTPGMLAAQALHARMQPLLLFFVDGGSAIDVEDPCWTLLLALRVQGEHTVVVRALAQLYRLNDGQNLCWTLLLALCAGQAQYNDACLGHVSP